MTIFQSLILGIVQGITEFLPISSSGHLVLGESFFELEVEKLRAFDVVVHVGTLGAIFIYFWKDFAKIFKDIFSGNLKMMWFLIVGTIPAVIAGFTMSDLLDSYFRSVDRVALAMMCAAFLFIFAEELKRRNGLSIREKDAKSLPGQTEAKRRSFESVSNLNWKSVIIIGLFQSLALIPGVSRSGSTISAGLIMGMSREEAARFSFILGSIAIFGAGVLTTKDVVSEGLFLPAYELLIVGFISSLIAGYVSVAFLMKFLKSNTLHVFAIYLILLGGSVVLF